MFAAIFGFAGMCAECVSTEPVPDPKPKTQAEIEEEKILSGLVAKFGPMPRPSAWDGSYFEVEQYLKGTLRDPDSLTIETCTKVDHTEEGWLVGCDYRARNGFGGMNRESDWFLIRAGRVVASQDAADAGT